MPTTVVRCSRPDCQQPAAYKIAAQWSDGRWEELKTFGFACQDHVGVVFGDAQERYRNLEPSASPGEAVAEVAIYKFECGKRDRQLQRLWGLEENYRT